jgi:hypothetical protein
MKGQGGNTKLKKQRKSKNENTRREIWFCGGGGTHGRIVRMGDAKWRGAYMRKVVS